MSFDLVAMRRLVAAHGPVVRVVVAATGGSVPREVGASICVWDEGQEGTIGGGALEYEAVQRARSMVEDRMDRVPLGPGLGQCCGGAVTLVSERWDAARLDSVTGEVLARGAGEPPLIVTRLLAQARNGQPVVPQYHKGWMVEPLVTPSRPLWIFGAGHVGRALVSVLAPLPHFSITWVDVAANRFPDLPEGVTQLIAQNPADTVHLAPRDAAHLVLTFSHPLDLEICHRLLAEAAGEGGFYSVGLIGSATKRVKFRKRLSALGHSETLISRIDCPIGQPELGKHPQAIAVGVAAELLNRNTEMSQARKHA